MILSNTAEFIPWVIQPKREKNFTERTRLARTAELNASNHEEPVSETDSVDHGEQAHEEAHPTVSQSETPDMSQNQEELSNVEEVIPPELIQKYTTVEFNDHGEAEYLRGYNSCKENEQLEFSGRLEQLDALIATLRNEHVDLNEFYEPMRELIIAAIEAIMQVDLTESKESISRIVATILEEITRESDGSVRVFLNPSDTSLLKDFEPKAESEVKILSDPRLTKGSARAVMGDSIIESLRENRLDQMVNQILGEVKKKSGSSMRNKNVNRKKPSNKKA